MVPHPYNPSSIGGNVTAFIAQALWAAHVYHTGPLQVDALGVLWTIFQERTDV